MFCINNGRFFLGCSFSATNLDTHFSINVFSCNNKFTSVPPYPLKNWTWVYHSSVPISSPERRGLARGSGASTISTWAQSGARKGTTPPGSHVSAAPATPGSPGPQRLRTFLSPSRWLCWTEALTEALATVPPPPRATWRAGCMIGRCFWQLGELHSEAGVEIPSH